MPEPVMPDPGRTVTTGVNILHRLGVSDREALLTIMDVAMTAGQRLRAGGNPKIGWLRQVWRNAHDRLPQSAKDEYERTRKGNGEKRPE